MRRLLVFPFGPAWLVMGVVLADHHIQSAARRDWVMLAALIVMWVIGWVDARD